MIDLNVIVITHGNLVYELISTCEFFAGKQSNFYGLAILPGDTIESVSEQLNSILSENENSEFVICVDILGGTPFNVACLQKKNHRNIHIIPGVNLPMLLFLSLEINSYSNIDEIKNTLVSELKESIKFI